MNALRSRQGRKILLLNLKLLVLVGGRLLTLEAESYRDDERERERWLVEIAAKPVKAYKNSLVSLLEPKLLHILPLGLVADC